MVMNIIMQFEEKYIPVAVPPLDKWSMCLADWVDLLLQKKY